jgi:hypothetical protein
MSDMKMPDVLREMEAIKRLPSLQTINGIGTATIGRRDYDPDTDTYVKTVAFCIFYIPVLALSAYRMAKAPGEGWYFLGRVRLSRFARAWNFLLPLGIVGAIGAIWWNSHVNSPDYLAGRKVAEADRLAAAGQGHKAAETYREVMAGRTAHAAKARGKLKQLVLTPPDSADEAAGVLAIALDLQRLNDPLVPKLFEHGKKFVEQHAEGDPPGALAVLEVIAPLATKPDDLLRTRRRLLERLHALRPGDAELASRLAVVYQDQGETARCEALLAPHAAKLGQLEGAAILGRIYAAKDKHEQAYALLQPYVTARLPKLHTAERTYRDAETGTRDEVVRQLQSGSAPGFNCARYQAATKPEQQAMLAEYLEHAFRNNHGLRAAQKALAEQAPVANAAMDLGIIQLHRGQSLADPAARRKELVQAEKTFLAIGGVAGGTPQYRLRLGQVYYWLCRHQDGRKLVDEMLQAEKRSTERILQVGHVLREVGPVSEARALVEEAYGKETDAQKKYLCAQFRAVMPVDLDDQITWWGRADPDNVEVKASLLTAKGRRAEREGKDGEAAAAYRQAIATYAKMPDSAAALNNCALAHFALYQLTHDDADLGRGVDNLDRAVALNPNDSIPLTNAYGVLIQNAARDLIGGAIDLKALNRTAGLDLLPFLYKDDAGRRQYVERLRKHPGMIKARRYLEKLLVLAPKQVEAYGSLTGVHAFTRDLDGMRAVYRKLHGVELDLTDSTRDTLEYYSGKDDAKLLKWLDQSLARKEAAVAATRKGKGKGATFAAAANALGAERMRVAALGCTVDSDALVRVAEEAHAAAPSSATHSGLMRAYRFRAHQRFVRQDRALAEVAARTSRSLGPSLLGYFVGREGPLRDKLLADADVKRVLALKLEECKAFPADQGATTWALLRAAHPAEAERVAKLVREDPAQPVRRAIVAALSPLDADGALEEYWVLKLGGKDREAEDLLKHYADRKVPLPVDDKK